MSPTTVICKFTSEFFRSQTLIRIADQAANETMWRKSLEFLDPQIWEEGKYYEYKNMGDVENEERVELTRETVEQVFEDIDDVMPKVIGQIDGEWWVATDFENEASTHDTDEYFAAFYLKGDQVTVPDDDSDQLDYLKGLNQKFEPCVLVRGDEDSGETGSGWLADLGG